MADNIAITPGSGATVRTDDIDGVHYQVVKLAWGDDGTASFTATATPLPTTAATGGTIRASAVSVGTTATALPAAALASRRRVIVQNLGATTVYLGGTSVTAAAGLAVRPEGAIALDLLETAALYGIVASGTADVRVLECA